jgi:hypothetical protein
MNSKDNTKSLFVISSPFQAICAIEAVHEYEVKNPVFIILLGKNAEVNSNTLKVLDLNNITNVYKIIFNSFFDLVLNANKRISEFELKLNSYETIFIGDYLSTVQRFFSSCFLSKTSKIVFLDDGNSTIEVFKWGNRASVFRSWGIFIKTIISEISFISYKKKSIEYFTIFDYDTNKFNKKLNNLRFLKSKIKTKKKNGVYIIGSNIYNINFLSKSQYIIYFEKIIRHVEINYPDEPIYYCPHRGEPTDTVELLKSKYKIHEHKSEYTIEIDVIKKSLYPVAIYSFGSTATYSLKIIYPNIDSYSIPLETNRKTFNKCIKEINQFYSKNDISILN